MPAEDTTALPDLAASPSDGHGKQASLPEGAAPTIIPQEDGSGFGPKRVFDEFAFDGQPLMVLQDLDGGLWFIAKQVCGILGISNVGQALSRLDDDERKTINPNIITDDVWHGRWPLVISEAGLYQLILGSRKPVAHRFRRWLTHDVVPSIRRHGVYATDGFIARTLADPDYAIEVFTQYRDTKRELEETKRLAETQAKRIEADRPHTMLGEAIDPTETMIYVSGLAKIITQSYWKNGSRYQVGGKRLFGFLRDDGFVGRSGEHYNLPHQRYVQQGLFFIRESHGTHTDDNGVEHTYTRLTTQVTGKGQAYFLALYGFGGTRPLDRRPEDKGRKKPKKRG